MNDLRTALERHFNDKLYNSGFYHESYVAGTDPTQVDDWEGYVVLSYDPWAEVDQESGCPPHGIYQLEINSGWGTWIRMRRCNDYYEPRNVVGARTPDLQIFVPMKDDTMDPEHVRDFDRLLDGEFLRGWVEVNDFFAAPEPDYPRNV